MKPLIRFTYPHSVRIGDCVVVRSWREEKTFPDYWNRGKTKTREAGWDYHWCTVEGITRFAGNTVLFLEYSQLDAREGKRVSRTQTRVCKPSDMVPVVVAGHPLPLWEGEPDA